MRRTRRTRALRGLCIAGAAAMSAACSGAVDADRVSVATVVLTPTAATLAVGSSMVFHATVMDADGEPLTDRAVFWASSDRTVADVDSLTGVVRALSLGTAQIAASSEGKYAIATVTVSPVPVASVDVLPPNLELSVGVTAQLRAVTYDATGEELTGRVVIWASSNPAVATTDDTGLVRGVAPGSASITATSEGQSGSASVTVQLDHARVTRVEISPKSVTLQRKDTQQFTARVFDQFGNELQGRMIEWESSDRKVVRVSNSGLATARHGGVATVTARCEGVSDGALVRVR